MDNIQSREWDSGKPATGDRKFKKSLAPPEPAKETLVESEVHGERARSSPASSAAHPGSDWTRGVSQGGPQRGRGRGRGRGSGLDQEGRAQRSVVTSPAAKQITPETDESPRAHIATNSQAASEDILGATAKEGT